MRVGRFALAVLDQDSGEVGHDTWPADNDVWTNEIVIAGLAGANLRDSSQIAARLCSTLALDGKWGSPPVLAAGNWIM